jgi:hypothetical protein
MSIPVCSSTGGTGQRFTAFRGALAGPDRRTADARCAVVTAALPVVRAGGAPAVRCVDVFAAGRRRGGAGRDAASTRATAAPISAGLVTTVMPAFFIAVILAAAVPLPPEMMAPAWPIRRPGGAVCPQMNPTTGLVR